MDSLARNNSEKKERNGWQSRFARRHTHVKRAETFLLSYFFLFCEDPTRVSYTRFPNSSEISSVSKILLTKYRIFFRSTQHTLIDEIINQKLSLLSFETYLSLYRIVIFNTRQYVLWLYFNTRNYRSRFI